jgi:hypothetical protein
MKMMVRFAGPIVFEYFVELIDPASIMIAGKSSPEMTLRGWLSSASAKTSSRFKVTGTVSKFVTWSSYTNVCFSASLAGTGGDGQTTSTRGPLSLANPAGSIRRMTASV